jgi:Flp pilus assembly protein TadG
MSTARPCSHGQRGGTAVETAFVMTICLGFMFGVIDFGRALYTYHLVSNAAREGSRYAMVRGTLCTTAGCPATASSIRDFVRTKAIGIDPSAMAVTTTWPTGGNCTGQPAPGCQVVVTVAYSFGFITAFMPNLVLPMSSASTMVISQ